MLQKKNRERSERAKEPPTKQEDERQRVFLRRK